MIDNILFILFLVIIILLVIFLICCMNISSKISRKEEYRMLDPKELDDEFKFEDILEYDDIFIKKDRKKNEKRDNF